MKKIIIFFIMLLVFISPSYGSNPLEGVIKPIRFTYTNTETAKQSIKTDGAGVAWIMNGGLWYQYFGTTNPIFVASGVPSSYICDNGHIVWNKYGVWYYWNNGSLSTILPLNGFEFSSNLAVGNGTVTWLATLLSYDEQEHYNPATNRTHHDEYTEVEFQDVSGSRESFVSKKLTWCEIDKPCREYMPSLSEFQSNGNGRSYFKNEQKIKDEENCTYEVTSQYIYQGSENPVPPQELGGRILFNGEFATSHQINSEDYVPVVWTGSSNEQIPVPYPLKTDGNYHGGIIDDIYGNYVFFEQVAFYDGVRSRYMNPTPDNYLPIGMFQFYDSNGGVSARYGVVAFPCWGRIAPGVYSSEICTSNLYNNHGSIFVSSNPLVPGEFAWARVYPLDERNSAVWSITRASGTADAKISGDGNVAVITDIQGEGELTINVTSPDDPSLSVTGTVPVGCSKCSSGSCSIAGGSWFKLSSIDAKFYLGSAYAGQSAGYLSIKADQPAPENATPAALTLSGLGHSTVFYDGSGLISRVEASDAVAYVSVIDQYSYAISLYEKAAFEGQIGPIDNPPVTPPSVIWTIENPDRSATIYNRLKITETRGSEIKHHEYAWDAASSTWSLSKGDGGQIVTKSESFSGGNRIVREITKNSLGVVSADVQKTFKNIMADGQTKEELIEVSDPTVDALTTRYSFYEDPSCISGENCGLLKSRENVDGSWVKYEYDVSGRVAKEISSWKDVGITADSSLARVIENDFTPLLGSGDTAGSENFRLPRTVTEKIENTVVGKTFHVYITGEGERTEIEEKATDIGAQYGASTNIRTETKYFTDPMDSLSMLKVKSIKYPDGRLDTYAYDLGSYSAGNPGLQGTFTQYVGNDYRRTLVHGTTGSTPGIAGKSTIEKTIYSEVGRVLQEETYVYTGTGEVLISWTKHTYDSLGHETRVDHSDGTFSEAGWNCCGKDWETDIRGIRTDYDVYDDLGRLEQSTRHLLTDIVTTYTYDAEGRVLTETVTGGGLSSLTTRAYDLAGRLDDSTDSAGLYADYSYSNGGRTSTVVRPGDSTEVTDRYLDGRTKSVTVDGVVVQYYEYGVNADGSQWTKAYTGDSSSPMWEKTTVNMVGQVSKVEKPGPDSTTETRESFYNTLGQLWKTTEPGKAATIYGYDSMGELLRTILDVDDDQVLSVADRVEERETSYAQYDGAWWRETVSRIYPDSANNNPVVSGRVRERLTGLGNGLVAETVSIDISGNQTVQRVTIDRTLGTETRTTDYPDSDTDAVETYSKGFLVSSRTKTGLTTNFGYDGLGRRTVATDPRTGPTTTHYNSLGQVDWVDDAALKHTSYAYEPDTGRLSTETDPNDNVKRYKYDLRGHLKNVWGSGAYPVEYVYDDFGRRKEMHTWRTDTGIDWNSSTWPNPPAGDVTKWHYDPATGLLESKEDASAHSVSYAYYPGGRLKTRTWARQEGGSPLVTTYSYYPATGELWTVDYSDSTPDVTYTYDRLGRMETVTDALGSRTFAYDPATLRLYTETMTGLYQKTITRVNTGSGLAGRDGGFALDGDYGVTYGYDAKGRFETLGYTLSTDTGATTYGYLPDSDMLQTVTTAGGPVTTFGYESHRNLKTMIKNQNGSVAISQYDYTYDNAGRRDTLIMSGSEPAKALTQKTLNAQWFEDALHPENGIEILPDNRAYTYDPIGNRKTLGDWNTSTLAPRSTAYAANSLDQYTSRTVDGLVRPLVYDLDGNVTDDNFIRYTWDGENRLKSVESRTPVENSFRHDFIYDYMGRRIEKRGYKYQSGAWVDNWLIRYVYDGWNLIQELNSAGGNAARYVWGPDLSGTLQGAGGIGGLVAWRLSSTTYYYLYDGNGNVGQLINKTTGETAAHYEYDPFGNSVYYTGPMKDTNPFRFSTKYRDTSTGLYYYGYRYYNTTVGRWLNRDPIEEKGGLNLYGFVGNNGVNGFDMLGLAGTYSGYATYYNLVGNKTASGEFFAADIMAAAMTKEKVPKLGTTVTVKYVNKENCETIINVTVNDRGPFARGSDGKALKPLEPDPEKIIDLTPEAFKKLVGDLKAGKVKVTVEVP